MEPEVIRLFIPEGATPAQVLLILLCAAIYWRCHKDRQRLQDEHVRAEAMIQKLYDWHAPIANKDGAMVFQWYTPHALQELGTQMQRVAENLDRMVANQDKLMKTLLDNQVSVIDWIKQDREEQRKNA